MPHDPLLSVIIPTYNAARFLPEALASVRQQEIVPDEIIVVDDGSTDDTAALLATQPDITYLFQSNQGPSAARNAGIRRARGELLAFLDADDLWTPTHLIDLWQALAADPAALFVWGHSLVAHLNSSDDAMPAVVSPKDGQTLPLFLVGAGLYRRQAFERVGLFDPTMRMAEDLDWIARARQTHCPQLVIDAQVLTYRKHAGGMTAGKSFEQLNVMAMLRRSIARQRTAGNSRPIPTPQAA